MACCSPEKSGRFSTGLLFVGLAFLAAFNYWWPGILLVLGVYRGFKFFLDGHHKAMVIHLIVFIGLYLIFTIESVLTGYFSMEWVLPAIFAVLAIFCFLKCCCCKGCGKDSCSLD